MLLPRLADLLGGLMWFATGLLVASRTARWVGSRLMPVGFAFIVTVLASMLTMYFWEFELIVAVATAMLLATSGSAFVEGGELPRQRWISRTFAAISLGTGWIVTVALAIALAAELMDTFIHASGVYTFRYYQVLDDGRIAVVSSDGSSATDPDGNPLGTSWKEVSNHGLASAQLNLGGLHPEEMPLGERESYWGFHSASAHLRLVFAGLVDSHREGWWYVVSRNAIEGYSYPSSRFIGSRSFPERLCRVGANDFYSAGAGQIVAGARNVWHLDFEHSDARIFVADPGDEILDASSFRDTQKEYQADPPPSSLSNVVATRKGVYVFKNGQPPVRFDQAYQSPAYNSLAVGRTIDGRLVLDYYPQEGAKHPAPRVVIFASADGKILKQVRLPDLSSTEQPQPLWDEALPALAVPPGLFVAIMQFGQQPPGAGQLVFAWTAICCIAGLAALASIPLSRRRQYSAIGTVGWAIVSGIVGIPGLLLLLSMDDAIPTVNCNACGHQRPITRSNCPHCAADFPPPARTGIEVFAIV
jgi:hypothetical protein